MRRFSFRPALTIRGRESQGLRGWAGKPLHPPLTDVPAAAYVLVAAFDVISFVAGDRGWSREVFRAGSFLLTAGAVVALLAALTGYFDWKRSTEPGNQARRTVNAHAVTMLTATAIVATNLALRWTTFADDGSTPAVVLLLSLVGAVVTVIGGMLGGSLVFDYGFNVVGADYAWEKSERDVLPGADAKTEEAAPQANELPRRTA